MPKGYIRWQFHLYEILKITKSIEVKNRLVVVRARDRRVKERKVQ